MSDIGKITKPWHYQHNGIETIDVIEAWTCGLHGDTGYCIGNAIKYISRWNKKNGEKDLLKVLWYVARVLGRFGLGSEAIETVQAAVRRRSEEQSSKEARGHFPDSGKGTE